MNVVSETIFLLGNNLEVVMSNKDAAYQGLRNSKLSLFVTTHTRFRQFVTQYFVEAELFTLTKSPAT